MHNQAILHCNRKTCVYTKLTWFSQWSFNLICFNQIILELLKLALLFWCVEFTLYLIDYNLLFLCNPVACISLYWMCVDQLRPNFDQWSANKESFQTCLHFVTWNYVHMEGTFQRILREVMLKTFDLSIFCLKCGLPFTTAVLMNKKQKSDMVSAKQTINQAIKWCK